MEAHETQDQIEHAHGGKNKRAAILIIALAALLAIAEMAGKHAQTASVAHNIETSDLWAFYQAKTIRSTTVRTAIESAQLSPPETGEAETRKTQIAAWQADIDRYDSEPVKREGRKELAERAKATAALRDHELQAYHKFEYASAALQLAIVMASAAVITEIFALELVSVGLGLVGLGLALMGRFVPMLLEF